MRGGKAGVFALIFILMLSPVVHAGDLGGIGVLGDSYSDEYQFYDSDRASARSWVEILAPTRHLNFGRFSLESRGEPRREGYEFNWARSDATTTDLLTAGQHIGLAKQIAAGEVSVVVLFIGGNDFIHALLSDEPADALERVLPTALANYRTALETVLSASPEVKVVTVTVPDVRDLPLIKRNAEQRHLPDSLLDRATAALATYNNQIRRLAFAQPRIAVADFDMAAKIANRFSRDHAFIGGRRLDRLHSGNDLGHLFLADQRHFGTMGQGLLAQMIINAIDTKFAQSIRPLSDREIASFAAALSEGSSAPSAVANLAEKAANPQALSVGGR